MKSPRTISRPSTASGTASVQFRMACELRFLFPPEGKRNRRRRSRHPRRLSTATSLGRGTRGCTELRGDIGCLESLGGTPRSPHSMDECLPRPHKMKWIGKRLPALEAMSMPAVTSDRQLPAVSTVSVWATQSTEHTWSSPAEASARCRWRKGPPPVRKASHSAQKISKDLKSITSAFGVLQAPAYKSRESRPASSGTPRSHPSSCKQASHGAHARLQRKGRRKQKQA